MARSSRTGQKITRDGLETAYTVVDVAEGETIPLLSARTMFLTVVNADAENDCTVKLVIAEKVAGVTPDPKEVVVPGGGTREIGPFPANVYEQEDGAVYVDYELEANPPAEMVTAQVDGNLAANATTIPLKTVVISRAPFFDATALFGSTPGDDDVGSAHVESFAGDSMVIAANAMNLAGDEYVTILGNVVAAVRYL